MKILALDIGAGTKDILLFDSNKNRVENCIKMVLPSPSQVFAFRVKETTQLRQDLFIDGDIIGGGAFTSALRNHIKAGLQVFMTENSAYTVRNDLDEVKKLGITIMREPSKNFKGKTLTLQEVNLIQLKTFLEDYDEPLSDVDVVVVAVQDHGVFPKGTSNRRIRIQKMKQLLETDARPEVLAFTKNQIPSCFLRMQSAAKTVQKQLPEAEVLVMDTAPAAILGCLNDPVVMKYRSSIAMNIGNGHTIAAIIIRKRIVGLIEHHTRFLNPQKIMKLIEDFTDGTLTDDQIFMDGGHGLFYLEDPPGFSNIEKVVVTGPNRKILAKTKLHVHFAAPSGDVMMTGPMGMVEATIRKFRLA